MKDATRPIKLDDSVLGKTNCTLDMMYDGKRSYLWIGDSDTHCVGTLSGGELIKMARKIVHEFDKHLLTPKRN